MWTLPTLAMRTIEQVGKGRLPFDRTMRISTAENLGKPTITLRLPVNLSTLDKLLKQNQDAWQRMRESRCSAVRHRQTASSALSQLSRTRHGRSG